MGFIAFITRGSVLTFTCTVTAALGVDVGSPAINRALNDGSAGVTLIYRGGTQPVSGPGQLVSWQFFDNESSGYVTPLLLEVIAPAQYKLVGLGASRQSNASGAQSFAFNLIAGTATLEAGKTYTVGFQHAQYNPPVVPGGNAVIVGTSVGVVDFDGYNNFTDPWSYSGNALQVDLGETFGLTGSGAMNVMDNAGFTGRIYSARFTFDLTPNCPGDVDFDTDVDFDDLNRVLNVFGQTNTGGDADGDGDTDFDDLNLVLSNFGNACA